MLPLQQQVQHSRPQTPKRTVSQVMLNTPPLPLHAGLATWTFQRSSKSLLAWYSGPLPNGMHALNMSTAMSALVVHSSHTIHVISGKFQVLFSAR